MRCADDGRDIAEREPIVRYCGVKERPLHAYAMHRLMPISQPYGAAPVPCMCFPTKNRQEQDDERSVGEHPPMLFALERDKERYGKQEKGWRLRGS